MIITAAEARTRSFMHLDEYNTIMTAIITQADAGKLSTTIVSSINPIVVERLRELMYAVESVTNSDDITTTFIKW